MFGVLIRPKIVLHRPEERVCSLYPQPVTLLPPATAKLRSGSVTHTVQNGDGEIRGEEITGGPPGPGVPPPRPLQSSGGMRRAEYTITRLSSCRRPAEGKWGESRAGQTQGTDARGSWKGGSPGVGDKCRVQPTSHGLAEAQAAPGKVKRLMVTGGQSGP